MAYSIIAYRGGQRVDPSTLIGDGGQYIEDNLVELLTRTGPKYIGTGAPTADDDSAGTSGRGPFFDLSSWIQTDAADPSGFRKWTCLDATPTAAVWTSEQATPADPFGSVQFNNAGSFGGSANLTWDGSTLQIVGIGGDPLTLTRKDDADHFVTIQGGATANTKNYLQWRDKDGNIIWQFGKEAAGHLIEFASADQNGQPVLVHTRYINAAVGPHQIGSIGAGSVEVNGYGDAGMGWGGLMVKSGDAATGFALDPALNHKLLFDLQFDAGSTLFDLHALATDKAIQTRYYGSFGTGDLRYWHRVAANSGNWELYDQQAGGYVYRYTTATASWDFTCAGGVKVSGGPIEVGDLTTSGIVTHNLPVGEPVTINSQDNASGLSIVRTIGAGGTISLYSNAAGNQNLEASAVMIVTGAAGIQLQNPTGVGTGSSSDWCLNVALAAKNGIRVQPTLDGYGVHSIAVDGMAVRGDSSGGYGGYFHSTTGVGLYGSSSNTTGIHGWSGATYAGYFTRSSNTATTAVVYINQTGGGSSQPAFQIRHAGTGDLARFQAVGGTERVKITNAGELQVQTYNQALALGAAQEGKIYHDAARMVLSCDTGAYFPPDSVIGAGVAPSPSTAQIYVAGANRRAIYAASSETHTAVQAAAQDGIGLYATSVSTAAVYGKSVASYSGLFTRDGAAAAPVCYVEALDAGDASEALRVYKAGTGDMIQGRNPGGTPFRVTHDGTVYATDYQYTTPKELVVELTPGGTPSGQESATPVEYSPGVLAYEHAKNRDQGMWFIAPLDIDDLDITQTLVFHIAGIYDGTTTDTVEFGLDAAVVREGFTVPLAANYLSGPIVLSGGVVTVVDIPVDISGLTSNGQLSFKLYRNRSGPNDTLNQEIMVLGYYATVFVKGPN